MILCIINLKILVEAHIGQHSAIKLKNPPKIFIIFYRTENFKRIL